MKTIAGAILILAGVIPLCCGLMLGHSNWFTHADIPGTLQAGGAVGMLVGLGLLVWGLIVERASKL